MCAEPISSIKEVMVEIMLHFDRCRSLDERLEIF